MNFKFPNKRLAARLMAVTAITLATASCSWLESLDKDPTADWSADKLYTEARAALEESNWTDAKDYYTKLEARYPFGTYAQQAQIELIYANWKDGDAAQAVQGADRFLQAYPNHANSDYVMYLKALATLNENDGWFAKLAAQDLAERDANAAQEAFDILKELALRFPDSRYAPERAAACTSSCWLRQSMNLELQNTTRSTRLCRGHPARAASRERIPEHAHARRRS